jgi:CRP/FNR family cyclic AMP-dependent transcriptional regulator
MSTKQSPILPPPSAKLRAIGVLAEALSGTRRFLEEKSSFRLFDPGATVWSDGDKSVAVIQSGRAKLQLTVDSGQATTLEYLKVGDVTGLQTGAGEGHLVTSCVSTSVVGAVIIPDEAIQAALEADRDFRVAVNALTMQEISKLRKRLFEMANFSLGARLASHLLDLVEPYQGITEIKSPLTHEELALLLGANREAITRALRLFNKQALIDYSRKTLKILDPKGLGEIVRAR